ncbi:GAF domain-containing protein [Nodosilinea sp. FACHB-13]|uniref:GAF domain-containing protein n=1 Tax=Cyanophyceae TaxID=3028117 RepID=UPI001684C01F|nr:GAF domain-containing protein [Nodosilinea sp. FACHB-13]MBD2107286.1 GAF domain-containing protein [Nodosilinea sp. FACHB-13]
MRRQLTPTLIFAASAAVTGVIGNKADVFVDKVLPFLGKSLTFDVGTLVCILVLFSGPLTYTVIRHQAALRLVSDMHRLDDSLFRLIPSLYKASEASEKEDIRKKSVKKLMTDLVKLETFNTCGVALYCRKAQSDYLTTWLRYSTPNETDDVALTFFIGDDSLQGSPSGSRGIAGLTFLDNQIHIVHFDKNGDADDNRYIESPAGRIGYRSLICAAIPSENGNLGVLCLYSSHQDSFDRRGMRDVIQGIADRFSVLMEA